MNQPEKKVEPDIQPMAPFELRFQSGHLAVREALTEFLEALRPLKLDFEEAGTVELVLAEVLNNIVEHAYPPSVPDGPIAIQCAQQPDGLLLEITDRGTAMPDGRLPLGKLSPLEVEMEDLPEGGFGWFMIQHLAKDVRYDRIGNENHLKLRLAIGHI
jgi:serine/threonine-protein kinase RsbW